MRSVINLMCVVTATALWYTATGTNTTDSTCGCRYGKLDCSNRSLISLLETIQRSSSCHEIRIIDVSNNQLSLLDFPREFLHQNANTTVWAKNNRLQNLEGLEGWTGQSLDVENNLVRNVNISSLLRQAQHLHIANNLLTSLDLSDANELRYLNIKNNDLEEIKMPSGNCSLLFVDLSQNQLSTLPASLAQCSWIIMLDVSNNSISELPSAVLRLTKLRHTQRLADDDSPQLQVDLRGNPLATDHIIAAVRSFMTQEGNLQSIPEGDCECAVLRTSDRLYAPVKFCATSMCAENNRNMWLNV